MYLYVCVCVYSMLAVINYLPHAGDLLRLLITSQAKPTGGWFSCTNRESISVWGLVYLHTCTHVAVFLCACAWHKTKYRMSLDLMILHSHLNACDHLSDTCLLVFPQHWCSDATCVCIANRQHGLPELSTHCAGAFTAHERWETDRNTSTDTVMAFNLTERMTVI